MAMTIKHSSQPYNREQCQLPFWTPIHYGTKAATWQHRLIQGIDNYFNLKNDVAEVVPGMLRNQSTGVKWLEKSQPLWLTILKIISYATLIIPAILLCVKWVLRARYPFHFCSRTLPSGTEETGTFVNGVLEQGIRVENGQTVYIRPQVLIEDSLAGFENERENTFAEVMVAGKMEVIPIQRDIGESAYVDYVDSPYSILLELTVQGTGVLKHLLEHPHNHLMTLNGFIEFLMEPNAQDGSLIDHLDVETLAEVFELAVANKIDIDVAVIDRLFQKWAGYGHVDLIRALLTFRPDIIYLKLDIPSALTMALQNGSAEEATLLLEAMQKQNIPIQPAERRIYRIALHQIDLSEEELRELVPEELQLVFQVANVFVNKAVLEKWRQIFPVPPPVPPHIPSLFSFNMDAIQVEQTIRDYLVEMRANNQLFTKQEFAEKDQANFIYKDRKIGRLLAQKIIERTLMRRKDDLVKAQKHVAVMKPAKEKHNLWFDVGPWSNLFLTSPDLEIYAEKITPIDRKATREEMNALLGFIFFFKVHLMHDEHIMMGKNEAGAEGLYFIDIEQHHFYDIPHFFIMDHLKKWMAPENHEWLAHQIEDAAYRFEPLKVDLQQRITEQNWMIEPFAMMHGFSNCRTFTLPINDFLI
jgi:hypothetical protein